MKAVEIVKAEDVALSSGNDIENGLNLDDVDTNEEFESAVTARYANEDVGKNLDVTQMYLSEIGFSPLLSAE